MQYFVEAAYDYTLLQGIYIDRGDPAAWDYAVGDFTADNAWHDLDLSAIVPEHAKAVNLTIALKGPNVGDLMRLRRNGNANEIAAVRSSIALANVLQWTSRIVAIDTDRVLEYAFTNVVWVNINITVIGWIF